MIRNVLTALGLMALTLSVAPVQAKEKYLTSITTYSKTRINHCLGRHFSLDDDKILFRSPQGVHGEEMYTLLRFNGQHVRYSYTLGHSGASTSVTERFTDNGEPVYQQIRWIMDKCLFH